jgi:hypothetical protein
VHVERCNHRRCFRKFETKVATEADPHNTFVSEIEGSP